jgi:putative membrane protein
VIAHADATDHVAVALVALVAIGGYGWCWLRRPAPPAERLASWVAGVAVIVVASSSWVEAAAERSFTAHMAQHLLVVVIAAPLLVLARPWSTVESAVRIPPTATVRRVRAQWHRVAPLAALVGFVAVLFLTHLTSIYDRALHDRLLHEAEHAAYLLSAVVLWSTVRASGRAGAPARVGAVFGVMASSAVLGLILMSARHPLMPTYAAELGTEQAVDDQRTAAAMMWVGGMLATTPLLVLAFWRWAATEDRIVRRAELLADAERRPSGGTGADGDGLATHPAVSARADVPSGQRSR